MSMFTQVDPKGLGCFLTRVRVYRFPVNIFAIAKLNLKGFAFWVGIPKGFAVQRQGTPDV